MFAFVVVDHAGHSVLASVSRAMLGTPEILAILAVVVLLFGAAKLPQLGKGLGEAIGNFKKAKKDGEEAALRTEVDATPKVEVERKDQLPRA
jgi:sec-independent protein translocase protein TatA